MKLMGMLSKGCCNVVKFENDKRLRSHKMAFFRIVFRAESCGSVR